MSDLQLFDLDLVLLLRLRKHTIPVLIELLVLLNMCLLNFFLALLVREDHLLVVHLKLLFFELSDAILGHFSLYGRKFQRI